MAQRVYEGMFILDSNRYARDPGGVSGKVNQLIESHGGEILVSRLWVDQKLAYPIKGQRKGAYWLAYFRLDSLKLDDLKRQLQITDDILRSLMIKIDPRLVNTLVSHARGETEKPAEGEGEKAADSADKEPAGQPVAAGEAS